MTWDGKCVKRPQGAHGYLHVPALGNRHDRQHRQDRRRCTTTIRNYELVQTGGSTVKVDPEVAARDCSNADGRLPVGAARFVLRWSGPVSRILSWTTIYLGPTSPLASRGLTRASVGPTLAAPIRPCSGWGLPSRHVAVTLVRSYRTVSAFLPPADPAGEFSFLWHFPSARAAQPLAGILPCGVRTFLTPRRGENARPSSPLRWPF